MAHPETFLGGFIGAALVFLFTAYAIRAVGRAAWSIIKDVRDQFRENPGIMAGAGETEYGPTEGIFTPTALPEKVVPGIFPGATPRPVWLIFSLLEITYVMDSVSLTFA